MFVQGEERVRVHNECSTCELGRAKLRRSTVLGTFGFENAKITVLPRVTPPARDEDMLLHTS